MDTTQATNGTNGSYGTMPIVPPVDFRVLREKRKGWSVARVAEKIGFTPPSVYVTENRKKRPGSYLLAALASFHGVSFEDAWASYRPGEPLPPAADIEAAYIEAAARKPKRAKAKPTPAPSAAKPAQPTELDRLESEIAGREAAVAELERRLAEDWGDVETLAAHRRARDELRALLERWEAAFERAQG